ncbi:MAG: hypothetical protein NTY00_02430 [Deltaproteobacteria bacterium]|nr:hypothetical protein [Deltaproteobacteria bacterium]
MPKKPIHEFDFNAFSERLHSESDRACAVLGAALLDAKLEDVFRRRFQCFHNELLEGTGPISTFSARIRLARAQAWIDDDTRFDLDTIRGIRNDFAHSYDHDFSFSNQSVAARCANLRTAQAFIEGYALAAVSLKSNLSSGTIYSMQAVLKPPRMRYQLAVEFLSQYLDEIPEESPVYSGINILEEVRALSANIRIQASGSDTVGVPSPQVAPHQEGSS